MARPSKPKPPLTAEGKLFSTGIRGPVFTNHFYTSMNKDFGVKISVKNNTSSVQTIKTGGRVYNSYNVSVYNWQVRIYQVPAYRPFKKNFWVPEKIFSKLAEGTYTVHFWINDKKIVAEPITITYK